MKNNYVSSLQFVEEVVIEFSKINGKDLEFFPVFDLRRPDFGSTPWPGNDMYSVTYVIFDSLGNTLHVGTSESPGVGLGNYFGVNQDGTCRIKGDWANGTPAYLLVIGVGLLTEDGIEATEDYHYRFELRAYLEKQLYSIKKEPWFLTLRDFFLAVTPERLVMHLPWLENTRQLKELTRMRSLLIQKKLVTEMNTERFYLMANATDFGLNFLPAVDYRMAIFDILDENYMLPVNDMLKDFGWLMNLRLYRSNKIRDVQLFLYLMYIWFNIKLNPYEG